MKSNIETYTELLEVIAKHEETISKQNELITKLVNENAEQENIINVMMSEFCDEV